MFENLLRNWKTTALGISGFLLGISEQIKQATTTSGQSIDLNTIILLWQQHKFGVLFSVVIGLIGVFAKDHNSY